MKCLQWYCCLAMVFAAVMTCLAGDFAGSRPYAAASFVILAIIFGNS